jgi:arylformamidase
MTIYDISILLGEEDAVYPGDTPFSREAISSIPRGDGFELSTITLSAHAGTHVDAPAHFLEGERSIDSYPVQSFILPAHVVEIEDLESIKPGSLDEVDMREGEAVLFKTHNSISGLARGGAFLENYVHMSLEAAQLCIEKGIRLVGIDYISIDRYGSLDAPVHRRLLENEVLILEGIDLKEVPKGRYTLICPPLRIKGCEASPVRALLSR